MRDLNGQCQRSEDNFRIPCGNSHIDVFLGKPAAVVKPEKRMFPMTDAQIEEVLVSEGVMSPCLYDVIDEAQKILVILPDATRKSGAEKFLPNITAYAKQKGKTLNFIIAVGTHRQPTEAELRKIMTSEIYEEYSGNILRHDSENYADMDFYGITKRKTTVLLNKAYREHDTIITIGSVSYHYFAGYGGGRKLIFPGIGGHKAITANHKLAIDPVKKQRHEYAVTGNLKNNPVHDDLVESVMIARAGHNFYAVNTILTEEGEIADMVCGDLFLSHLEACSRLDSYCLYEPEKKFDLLLVSAGGYPKDINMIQSQKYLDRVLPLVSEGGRIVFFAQCPDGYGNKFFEDFFDVKLSSDMLNGLIHDYKINRQTAFNLKSNLERYEVFLYSDFSEYDCERMGFKKLADLSAIRRLADSSDNIGFVPYPADLFVK
ncbi:nickel-dependent lactate racemase [Seleniivibrio woodruffii]|uniref:Nickel-dependent lactate racemase n=1 Tax=Seleniivibrio woodruffii TaxID=1078050 RepID=A0A4R1K675_9BACT|nr:nickel-dependent lactate racemase [Seleniivibrio woodruffii]TCK59477.1 nickel-dependent lactate racemase [Seleniivibrio woodruffii]TVZ35482.1 nickel-dependent lactate racemase [Seleniivibrio woodruffii]